MSYATPQEAIEKYTHAQKFLIQLTNLDGGTVINEFILQAALNDASKEMDSYIQVRHELPLTSIPKILKNINIKIALKNLDAYGRHEKLLHDYQQSIKWLKMLAKGEVLLGLDEIGETTPIAEQPQWIKGGECRIFSTSKLNRFTIGYGYR